MLDIEIALYRVDPPEDEPVQHAGKHCSAPSANLRALSDSG